MKDILLVDDDDICNFISTQLLKQTGMFGQIHSALNGQMALELLNRYYGGTSIIPEVILLDLNMPVMDGFGFIEAFKKVTLPMKEVVKIIVLSTSADPNDKARAMSMGASNYIVKPLTEEKLFEALGQLTLN